MQDLLNKRVVVRVDKDYFKGILVGVYDDTAVVLSGTKMIILNPTQIEPDLY
jgi:hypothetical protein